LPFEVSGRGDDLTANDVWNGPQIQEIRRSIHDGDFKYCSRLLCPFLVKNSLPTKQEAGADPKWSKIVENRELVIEAAPRKLQLSHDPSCNLACPSCRTSIIQAKNADRDLLDDFAERVVLPLLANASAEVMITGFGDPFGSKHYRRTIKAINPKQNPNLRLFFVTNALLLTPKEWNDLGDTQSLVESISVSIDASTPQTYFDVRRPGQWPLLTANMDFIAQLRRSGKINRLVVNFVVQERNFTEMPEFVELGKQWGVDIVVFQKLWNFGAYVGDQLLDNDVADSRHPRHHEYLKILGDPRLKDPIVEMFNTQEVVA
jgi:MoaA/NifB/PqqE/SkfB family radical SAM enzyme